LGLNFFLSKPGSLYNFSNESTKSGFHICAYTAYLIIFQNSMRVISITFLTPSSEYTHMRIEEDKDGERFLVIENKEDLEEFRKMLIEAYYELHPDRKRET